MAALYRNNELSLRTLYAEVRERVSNAGRLLPGTPGLLVKRSGTGHEYWYRSYYPLPHKRVEEFVGPVTDSAAHDAMLHRIAFSQWVTKQVGTLSKVGYQVADKGTARVLVELYNRGLFQAGLVVVGTLAYMAWLNEYGAIVTASRTQDVDLARSRSLKLAATVPFFSSMQATQLPFVRVPGLPSRSPSTSVKLPGAEGLRVDILAPGTEAGRIVAVPELDWHAQTIPHYEYMLQNARPATVLAGAHCVPVLLPEVTRMIWHKLYASTHRKNDPGKAEKDLVQAVTLAALITEHDSVSLRHSWLVAPQDLQDATRLRMPRIEALLTGHPQAREEFLALR